MNTTAKQVQLLGKTYTVIEQAEKCIALEGPRGGEAALVLLSGRWLFLKGGLRASTIGRGVFVTIDQVIGL